MNDDYDEVFFMKIRNAKAANRRMWLRVASVFLIFAVFSNLLYIPCYYYIRDITRSNVLKYHEQRLTDGMRTFDGTVSALNNLRVIISDNTLYRSFTYEQSNPSTLTLNGLRSIIHNYLIPYDDLVFEFGLTMGNDVLFTSRRIYYENEALSVERYFSVKDGDISQYVNQFSGAFCVLPQRAFYSADYGDYDAITIALRWSTLHDIYFFATISVDSLSSLMADPNIVSNGSIAIRQGDAALSVRGETPSEHFERISLNSNALNLTFDIVISESYIEKDLIGFQSLTSWFTAFIILAALVWVVTFTSVMSRPLSHINDALRSSKHLGGDLSESGSFDEIAQGILRLNSQLNSYDEIMLAQKEQLRIHILESALYRGLYSAKALREFYESFPQFPKQWQMARIQFTSDEASANKEDLSTVLTKHIQESLTWTILLPVDGDTLLAVLTAEDGHDNRAWLEQILQASQREFGMIFSYTLSEIYDHPTQLSEAFRQMDSESFNMRLLESTPVSSKLPMSMENLQALYLTLINGDEKAALALLSACAALLIDGQDFFLCQYTYRLIANLLVMVKLESIYDLSGIPIPTFSQQNVVKLYTDELPRCISSICAQVSIQHKELVQDLGQRILTFIGENLSNPMLCITMVTEEFQISAPTLQKHLRSAVNKTFSAYIEEMRMKKARQMLIETNLIVQDIAQECGYASPNSFYKAYRRFYGETPLSVRNGGAPN